MGDTTVINAVARTPKFTAEERNQPGWGGTLVCGHCGNDQTTLWHEAGGGSIIGSWKELEVFCPRCEHYTAKITDYDS